MTSSVVQFFPPMYVFFELVFSFFLLNMIALFSIKRHSTYYFTIRHLYEVFIGSFAFIFFSILFHVLALLHVYFFWVCILFFQYDSFVFNQTTLYDFFFTILRLPKGFIGSFALFFFILFLILKLPHIYFLSTCIFFFIQYDIFLIIKWHDVFSTTRRLSAVLDGGFVHFLFISCFLFSSYHIFIFFELICSFYPIR